MNLFEITQADIERLKNNFVIWAGLSQRDKDIFLFVQPMNCYYINDSQAREPFSQFGSASRCYRIYNNYQLPTPTEEQIIVYLKASEVPPKQWPPVAQKWAETKQGQCIWETKAADTWKPTAYTRDDDGTQFGYPHRLRADYGEKKEPETCQWVYNSIHGYIPKHPHIAINNYMTCPLCGLRIEVAE